MEMGTTINISLLQRLYDQADEATRTEMQHEYPDLFEQYYDFGDSITITKVYNNAPFMIAYGSAPSSDLVGKCLIISELYHPEIFYNKDGATFIKFAKKRY